MYNFHKEIKLTQKYVSGILATLPVGYYLGYNNLKIKVGFASTSYFSPKTEEICISMNNLKEVIARTGKNTIEETTLRGLLYHEVSHALLTPDSLFVACSDQHVSQIEANIIEDERIETLLKHYYKGVNFERNKSLILCKAKTPTKTKEEYLFNVVRFHETEGHPELLKELADMIQRTAEVNSSSCYSLVNYLAFNIASLRETIYKVFDEEQKKKEEEKQKNKADQKDENGQEEEKEEKQEGSTSTEENEEQKEESKEEQEQGNSENEEENEEDESENEESSKGSESEEQEEEKEEPTEQEKKQENETVQAAVDGLKKQCEIYGYHKLSHYRANSTTKLKIMKIIAKNRGFGIEESESEQGYSGDFDPELRMTDFAGEKKWWSDNSDDGVQNNTGNKLTLNIWLDNSGSFKNNDQKVNVLLASLAELERTRKDFKFNLVKINTHFTELKGDQRVSDSWGGNALPKAEIEPLYKKLNKTGEERNIVLFDGEAGKSDDDCIWQGYLKDLVSYNNLWQFNNSRTTFITEASNTEGIRKVCGKASIIEENNNYPEELEKNVLRALEQLY